MPGKLHVADAVLTAITPKGRPGTPDFHHELRFATDTGSVLTINTRDLAIAQTLQGELRAKGQAAAFHVTLEPVNP